ESRVADEDVDLAQSFDGPGHDGGAGRAVEDVALDQRCRAAKRLDLGDDGLRLCGALAVVDGDVGTGSRQLQGAAAADASVRSGDQGFLAGEFHTASPGV